MFGLDHSIGSCSILKDKNGKELENGYPPDEYMLNFYFFFFCRKLAKGISVRYRVRLAMPLHSRVLRQDILHCTPYCHSVA